MTELVLLIRSLIAKCSSTDSSSLSTYSSLIATHSFLPTRSLNACQSLYDRPSSPASSPLAASRPLAASPLQTSQSFSASQPFNASQPFSVSHSFSSSQPQWFDSLLHLFLRPSMVLERPRFLNPTVDIRCFNIDVARNATAYVLCCQYVSLLVNMFSLLVNMFWMLLLVTAALASAQ